jgi:MiaB/RimO family radical SAM methylthiotransferase
VKTFSIQTLGCKVNQYEGEQLAGLLRARGLTQAPSAAGADLRVVHTCSVTVQAASKSRQTVRRAVRLPLLHANDQSEPQCGSFDLDVTSETSAWPGNGERPRVVVTGCWATSDRDAAAALPGVDAVLSHHTDVAAELDRLLTLWRQGETTEPPHAAPSEQKEATRESSSPAVPGADDGWMKKAGAPAGRLTPDIQANIAPPVKRNPPASQAPGTTRLPLLGSHQSGRQRAFLKVQDGCDAHCTYCIIPSLRPTLWSKPVRDVVEEAKALVDAGHVEIVLTGIFLGAYGQSTALRRRQRESGSGESLGELVTALCTRVPGLRRLRLSSLEPGDLTAGLIAVLRDHAQVVPHFHLPLQSGSQQLLRRMNRQYTRDEFLHMLDRVHSAFDRPALTTDVIVGFPGETDEEFASTVDVVNRARFIHVHAFSFSPRPGTAAARWKDDFVHGPIVNERIEQLNGLARQHSYTFRQQFVGETVELLVETGSDLKSQISDIRWRHGRCERYFDVTIPCEGIRTGDFVRAKITGATPDTTFGEVAA